MLSIDGTKAFDGATSILTAAQSCPLVTINTQSFLAQIYSYSAVSGILSSNHGQSHSNIASSLSCLSISIILSEHPLCWSPFTSSSLSVHGHLCIPFASSAGLFTLQCMLNYLPDKLIRADKTLLARLVARPLRPPGQ